MQRRTHDTQPHEELDRCNDGHEPEGSLFAERIIVDLEGRSDSQYEAVYCLLRPSGMLLYLGHGLTELRRQNPVDVLIHRRRNGGQRHKS